MHNITPMTAAQHLPAGWTMPAAPAVPTTVVGGGSSPANTITRVRWGRLALMLVGTALLVLGAWSAVPHRGAKQTVDTSTLGIAPAQGSGADEIATARAARLSSVPQISAARSIATKRTIARTRAARRAAAARASHRAALRRTSAAVPSVAGGGTAELPYTGASTWIAAIIGVMALLVGVLLHINAVRIGMTAMLYRRGILLRPIECARLVSQGSAAPRFRIWCSDVLHRLLEVPTTSGEFVSSRYS
ncbi:MAG: hypothetical protein JWN41_1009 [Thermoleophilia bacterium]|nr:hypothetical protein [Thermoleophilia bacterium]